MSSPLLPDVTPPRDGSHFPAWMHELHVGPLAVWQVVALAIIALLAISLGRLLQAIVSRLGGRLARVTHTALDDKLVATLNGPLWMLLTALLARAMVSGLELPGTIERGVDVIANSLVIGAVVWLALRLVRVFVQTLTARADPASGAGRALRTNVEVAGRFAQGATWLVGSAVFFMQFEVVRSVGVSLLASAGIAGVVLGLAAQKSVAQLFAGIQLSVTQPVRLGDLVGVDGKYGEVEEISLTYVILRTWDAKRMVMPISVFLDKPFENWSLGSLDLVAAVTLRLDLTADVARVRAEVLRLLTVDPFRGLHDGRSVLVAVTESDEKALTVRVSATVPDAGKAFELQCALREALLAWLAQHPQWLPRGRTEMVSPPAVPQVLAAEGKSS